MRKETKLLISLRFLRLYSRRNKTTRHESSEEEMRILISNKDTSFVELVDVLDFFLPTPMSDKAKEKKKVLTSNLR